MQTAGTEMDIIPDGYRYGPDLKSLAGLPVLASSTKSLLARWSQPAPAMLDVELADDEGLVVGSITNGGPPLRNARLLYGTWAYRLGNVASGQSLEVGEHLSPRKVKTIVTREALGTTTPAEAESRVFAADEASATELLTLMMFYDAAGGFGFAHLANRYQAFCDLSRQLELGRAILVAEVPVPAAQLVDRASGEPLGDPKLNTATVYYRFLLPVRLKGTP
jgi:hypothetical protein